MGSQHARSDILDLALTWYAERAFCKEFFAPKLQAKSAAWFLNGG
jgi:hypothetical protein